MEFTTACDENGYLTGMTAKVITDTGDAYALLWEARCFRALYPHGGGPYNYQNIDIDGTAAIRIIRLQAFRGFGVTQSCFATECNLNLLAEMGGDYSVGNPLPQRHPAGSGTPNGQIASPGKRRLQRRWKR